MPERFQFDDVVFDTGSGQVTRGGQPVALQPLTLTLLELLARHPGRLFTREELAERLWPDVHVTDQSLSKVVSRLRAAVGEGALRTVPRRGYRLEAHVKVDRSGASVEPRRLPPADLFVGRAHDLVAVREALDGGQGIVTLVGPGGVGKTRLALELLASAWAPDPVLTVDLAGHGGSAGSAVAVALGLPADVATRGAVGHALAQAGGVVLLDNAEEHVAELRELLPAWSARAPRCRFLVTSRQVLGIPGESSVSLGPLSTADAVELLAARTGLHAADTSLSALALALDGLPLALELAAARARVLSPSQLLERLQDRFGVLGHVEGPAGRHAGLTVVLEDSWAQLDGDQQEAAGLLATFRTPFALEAAEAMLGTDAVERLQHLVDRSWVQRDTHTDRFRLLQTLREWALAHRSEADRLEAMDRHATWLARRWAGARLLTPLLCAEAPDVLAAFEHVLEAGRSDLVTELVLPAWKVWQRLGPAQQAREVLERALAATDLPSWRLLQVVGEARASSGQLEAGADAFRTALLQARQLGPRPQVVTLLDLASCLVELGALDEARSLLDEALETATAAGDAFHRGLALVRLGALAHRKGDGLEALERMEAAAAHFAVLGEVEGRATSLAALGNQLALRGQLDEALEVLQESLDLRAAVPNPRLEGTTRQEIAMLLARAGRLDRALAEQRVVVECAHAVGMPRDEARALGNLGVMWLDAEQPTRAEACLQEALPYYRALGEAGRVGEAFVHSQRARAAVQLGHLRQASSLIDEALGLLEAAGPHRLGVPVRLAHAEVLLARGHTVAALAELEAIAPEVRRSSDATAQLLWLCGRARVARAAGDTTALEVLLTEAEALADASRLVPSAPLRARLRALRERA